MSTQASSTVTLKERNKTIMTTTENYPVDITWSVPEKDAPVITLGISKGMKIGLPNYSSAEVNVWVSVPSAPDGDSLRQATEFVCNLTDDILRKETAQIKS